MNPRARRAIIPAAGYGTRMRPFSAVVPKELVPLGSRPAIDWILDEAQGGGLREIGMVVGPHKGLIRRYLDQRRDAGSLAGLEITYIEQPEPLGLAEALSLCREFVADEPFALLMPDNLFMAADYSLASLVEAGAKHTRHVVAVLEVGEEDSGRFGNCGRIDGHRLDDGLLEITKYGDKKPGRFEVGSGERVLRACGRYLFQPDLFEAIEAVRPTVEGEFSEVPAVQHVARQGSLLGCRVPGPLFDVGTPDGVLEASAFLHRELLRGRSGVGRRLS